MRFLRILVEDIWLWPCTDFSPIYVSKYSSGKWQRVYFNDDGEGLQAAQINPPEAHLTAWFQWNRNNTHGRCHAISISGHANNALHMEQYHKKRNLRRKGGNVGRVYIITSPTMGELLYLRLLLHNPSSMGSTSFNDIKKIQGLPHETVPYGT